MIFSIVEYKNDIVTNNAYERGRIFDRNGNLLASSIISKSISTNPSKLKNKEILEKKISNILKIKPETINKILNSKKKFVWVKRNITPKQHQQIIDLGEINLRIHNEKKRIYPYNNFSSHIVGYVNIDQIGQGGVERAFDQHLKSSKDLKLSLDINLQQAVRSKLQNTIAKYRADSGLAVVLDIENGQILSSVSLPDFNPNSNSTFNQNNLINRVIQSNYEMGSTFKPITVAMGYDLSLIKPEMKFDVRKKFKGIGDYTKYKGNGIYNVEQVVVESSNIGTAKIASIIGKNNQINFFRKIGFFDKLDFEILESAKPLGNKNNWGSLETMTIGYGHGFAITPLHLISAYASIANKGFKVKPTILDNNSLSNSENILIKRGTSNYFLELLRSVVTKTTFTGPRVDVKGYNIGGKTGTANIVNENGGYYKDRDRTSFISIFPVNKPKYLVLAMLEYPKKIDGSNQKTTGAVVNAPLVKEIILDMINILNIPKFMSEDILKADTNYIYLQKNATL